MKGTHLSGDQRRLSEKSNVNHNYLYLIKSSMGNSTSKKITKWKTQHMKGNEKVGNPFECPVCHKIFAKSTTISTINSHIDNCLSTEENHVVIPAPIEREPSTELQTRYFTLL